MGMSSLGAAPTGGLTDDFVKVTDLLPPSSITKADDTAAPAVGVTPAGASSQALPKTVPRHLGSSAAPGAGGSASALAGTKAVSLPITGKVSTQAFANSDGAWGTAVTSEVKLPIDKSTFVTAEVRSRYRQPSGNGPASADWRLRVSANEVFVKDPENEVVGFVRATGSIRLSLADGAKTYSYGAGIGVKADHRVDKQWSIGASATADYIFNLPETGAASSSVTLEGEGHVDFAPDKNDKFRIGVTGYQEMKSNGPDANAASLQLKYERSVGQDVKLAAGISIPLDPSGNTNADPTYSNGAVIGQIGVTWSF
jgi:hypothetical protein